MAFLVRVVIATVVGIWFGLNFLILLLAIALDRPDGVQAAINSLLSSLILLLLLGVLWNIFVRVARFALRRPR